MPRGSARLAVRERRGRQRAVALADAPAAAVDLALRRRPSAGSSRVLALDGRSGAGKTRLAARVVEQAEARTGVRAALVAMEDLYPGWDGLEAASRMLHDDVLAPLAAGAPASYRPWDWSAGRPADVRVAVPAAPLLVVEGVGSGALAGAPLLTVLVWVSAPADLRRSRAMERDGAAYAPHWPRWAAQERDHLLAHRTRARADLLVRGAR